MVRNKKTNRMEQLDSVGDFYRFLPDLQREVSLEFFSIANLDSTDITPENWVEIAHTIQEHYDTFEGFVVIHGTNTMSYTASALSFALQNLRKPVVFTGSLLPINDTGSDGRMNLVFAKKEPIVNHEAHGYQKSRQGDDHAANKSSYAKASEGGHAGHSAEEHGEQVLFRVNRDYFPMFFSETDRLLRQRSLANAERKNKHNG